MDATDLLCKRCTPLTEKARSTYTKEIIAYRSLSMVVERYIKIYLFQDIVEVSCLSICHQVLPALSYQIRLILFLLFCEIVSFLRFLMKECIQIQIQVYFFHL